MKNRYAKHFSIVDNYGYEILIFNHDYFGGIWYLTIENKLNGHRETREYKTESAIFGTITKTVNLFMRANAK